MSAPSLPQLVDTESAEALLKEATKFASANQLEDIGVLLEAKAKAFAARLGLDAIDSLDRDGLEEVMGMMFSLRSRRRTVLAKADIPRLCADVRSLIYGEDPLAQRFDHFSGHAVKLEKRRCRSMASELLHFTRPERYWLWTWWIWDPECGKGALPLVTNEVDLRGASDGEIYQKVGKATARVAIDGAKVGYTALGRGLLGTDVFLSCVQCVYVFTVYKLRISEEFNRFLPELPELARRLLGVQRIEGAAV